jgi:hypothetical protein
MPTPRELLGTSVVNGLIYAVGGTTNSSSVGTVEAYDPATDTWTTKASMPTARNGLSTSVVNGILYAVGGSGIAIFGTVEAYDPATDTWTTKASMPTARTGLGTSVVNGVIYAVGGYNGSFLGTVEAYDPASNTWTTNTSMPTARYFLGTSVVNGVLYAVGGWSTVATFATNEAFTPPSPYSATVQQPINADGSSIFKASRGVVPVKFTLTLNGAATCQLPPATISVTRTAGGTTGLVDESTYLQNADNGSNFRISGCQYAYNLQASALGSGIYRVDISIDGAVVGTAVFALK